MKSPAREKLESFLQTVTTTDFSSYLVAREWLEEQKVRLFKIPNDQICFALRWLAHFRRCPLREEKTIQIEKAITQQEINAIRQRIRQEFPGLSSEAAEYELQSRRMQFQATRSVSMKRVCYIFKTRYIARSSTTLLKQKAHILPVFNNTIYESTHATENITNLLFYTVVPMLSHVYQFSLPEK